MNLPMVFADHPSHSPQELAKWGFKKFVPAPSLSALSIGPAPTPQNLPLPMDLKFSSEQFGAVINQFQDWTSPAYFHAGIDIRGEQNQDVIAPVSGRLEGGYYSYVDEVDGRSTKYFLPLREVLDGKAQPPWGKSYFEIAITDGNGFRFELHHVDPDLLTESIKTRILENQFVAAGEVVGQLVVWNRYLLGVRFHHLHYNIVSPDGIYLNPFALSEPINDTIAPQIVALYSPILPGPCGTSFPRLDPANDLSKLANKGYLVLEAFDQIFGGRESLAPAMLRADFDGQKPFLWDFTQALELPSGQRPNISKMHLYYLCTDKGSLQPASRSNHFYYIIPLPAGYSGNVRVTVTDQVGNSTSQTATVL
jgi:hypothetical protein